MKDKTIKLRTFYSRFYHLLFSNRFFAIHAHKRYRQEIIIDLVNKSGDISFTFINKDTKETKTFENEKSGQYIFPLEKGKKYRLIVRSNKACGSYKLSKKTYLIENNIKEQLD